MRLMQRSLIALGLSILSGSGLAASGDVSGIIEKLGSVHSIGEVTISPDGSRIVYGTLISGKRAGADVDVSALWLANAKDGSAVTRLTACPNAACDEQAAAWSPDGRQVAFVTIDEHDQPQIAVVQLGSRDARVITAAHGPLDTPR